MIDPLELLDDDALDSKKLFDESEYSTLIINRDGFSKKQNNHADLIMTLLEKNTTRAEAEVIFSQLKEANAYQILVDAIEQAEDLKDQIKLTAACWETGLDFSSHFLFFVELATHNDFTMAMEAFTVVENIEEPIDNKILNQALELAQESQSPHVELVDDLIENIKYRIV
jgi:hypothetical protein